MGLYCIIIIVYYEGCLGLLELNLVTTCVIMIEGCHACRGGVVVGGVDRGKNE